MRSAGNGKHASCDLGVRCFMQTALRRKTETGNEKDPSAALGMTKRERYISHCFSAHSGNRLLLAFPLGEGGPRQRRSGALVHGALETISLLSFIPLVPYPARSARHLPHAGKALFRKYRYPHPTSAPSGHLLPKEGGRKKALMSSDLPVS